MALEAQNNPYPSILIAEHADPEVIPDANPAVGYKRLVVKDDLTLWLLDDAGTATEVGGGGFSDPMTTRGDIIYRNSSNTTARLARGSASQVLTSDGTDLSWQTPSAGFSDPMTTRGDIIYRDSSNATARLAVGSSGKVLSSDGTDVSWQTPASAGSLVLLEQHTASGSASLNFTTCLTSTYDVYFVTLSDILNATNTQHLYLKVSTDGGSSWVSGTSYAYSHSAFAGSTPATASNSGQAQFQLTYSANAQVNSTSAYGYSGVFYMFSPLSTSVYTQITGGFAHYLAASTTRMTTNFTANWEATTAVNAFQILYASGNITSGTVRVYGVAK